MDDLEAQQMEEYRKFQPIAIMALGMAARTARLLVDKGVLSEEEREEIITMGQEMSEKLTGIKFEGDPEDPQV